MYIFLCTVSSSLINANSKLKWLHPLLVSNIELLSLISSPWKLPLTFLASHSSVHSPLLHIVPLGVIIYPHDLLPHHNVIRKAGPVARASWNFCSAQPASGLTVHLWDWRAQRSWAPRGIIHWDQEQKKIEVASDLWQVGSLALMPRLHNKQEAEAKRPSWTSSVREDEQSLLMHSNSSVISEQLPQQQPSSLTVIKCSAFCLRL